MSQGPPRRKVESRAVQEGLQVVFEVFRSPSAGLEYSIPITPGASLHQASIKLKAIPILGKTSNA